LLAKNLASKDCVLGHGIRWHGDAAIHIMLHRILVLSGCALIE